MEHNLTSLYELQLFGKIFYSQECPWSELLVETENRAGLYIWVYKRQTKHGHGCLEAEVTWSIKVPWKHPEVSRGHWNATGFDCNLRTSG